MTAWNAIDVDRLPRSRRRDRLLGAAVLPVLAFVAFSRYVPAVADALGDAPDGGYTAGPTFFWAIALMDLGVFLPATVAACFGLLRERRWAHKAVYTVVGWFALVGPAVGAMAFVMYVNDDPNMSPVLATFMIGLGLAFAALGFWVYRPLFRE